jgi:hypothetical protein
MGRSHLSAGSLQLQNLLTDFDENLFCEVTLRVVSSRDSAIGIATGYGLDGRGVGVRVPVGARFSPLHVDHTGSGAHPASYPIGTWGSSPGGKAAQA